MRYRYENIEVLKCIDGDTIDVLVHVGFKIDFTERFRLYGINAYEKRGKERERGLEALRWLVERIKGRETRLETFKDKKGKYGRYLATLYVYDKRWVNVNKELVEKGHAVINYYGKRH